ncbi:MAG: signal peptidase I [Candidatus Nanoarchaeia archaeon]|nr:signal peptidase I [Candidatus Nanoarchaeia archaeon]MDD5587668.1 signal peptidase I [Candidatus Nanoarchaeia archaeon]
MSKIKLYAKKTFDFIWYEESVASWIVNVILAFLIVKFLIYPGLGLILGTSYPVVAVVSSSMEHNSNFETWWTANENWYENMNITKTQFESYSFKNGFNKGDIMVLVGVKPEKIKLGQVAVFQGSLRDPIIHRVVKISNENNQIFIQTKGDNNADSRRDELKTSSNAVYGRALFKIPWLGYVKILFVDFINLVKNMF